MKSKTKTKLKVKQSGDYAPIVVVARDTFYVRLIMNEIDEARRRTKKYTEAEFIKICKHHKFNSPEKFSFARCLRVLGLIK